MRRMRLRRPGPAMVVAAIALVVALSGSALAGPVAQLARLVSGDKLIRKQSLSGNRLRKHTLTGTQINLSKLGIVPRANLANSAGFATSAGSATTANSAGSAPPTGPAGGALAGNYPNPSIAPGAVGPTQFGTIPTASAHNSSDESIPNNAETTLTYDTNEYDNAAMHSTTANSSRFTAPIAGVYEIVGEVLWAANASGERVIAIKLNGGDILSESRVAADPSSNTAQEVVTQARLSAGDYIELTVEQNSGGSLAATSAFRDPGCRMHWLGP